MAEIFRFNWAIMEEIYPRRDISEGAHLSSLPFQSGFTRQSHSQELPVESERRLRDLTDFVEKVNVALHLVSEDGIIVWANQAELRLLGYSRDEYIGHSITEFHVDEAVISDILCRLKNDENLWDYEARLRCRDGSVRYVAINSSVYREDGRFVHTRCVTRDITSQRQIAEIQQRLAAIVSSSDDAILSKDLNGIIQSWNQGAERIFGYKAGEIIGRHISTLAIPERIDEIPNILGRIAAGERVNHYETERRAKDGRTISVSLSISPIRDANGVIIGASKVARDITDRRRSEKLAAEQARIAALGADIGAALTRVAGLRESLQQCTEALVNHLDAAFARVWTLSPKESILELEASAGLYTHLDGPHARVPVGSFKIGRIALNRKAHLSNDVLNDPDVSDPAWARKEGMVAFAGYPMVVEDRLIGVFGLFARHALSQETLNALGSIADTMAIAIERKRSDEELARYTAELKRSNEDLEQFANVASHDLRSPLNTIVRFTELMVRRQAVSSDTEMAHFLQIIRDGAARMTELVSALLSYARLSDSGTSKLQPVSSRAAYENAIANLSAAIEEARAEIEHQELPEVLSNPAQLSQVFQNLISNAIHYRGDIPLRIKISAERQNRFWQFSVKDNGPGIAPQYHALIFEPFKRLHGSERPGSGIGLAFCRKFIEREGGKIWVESQLGRGACFYFTVPAPDELVGIVS